MRISLVLTTLDRVDFLERFLTHLIQQTHRDFELILVDQNTDNRLLPLVVQYQDQFPLRHVRSSERGVSQGRNSGLPYVTGDIVSFPDDDCWYGPGLLASVCQALEEHPEWDGASGRPVTEQMVNAQGNFDMQAGNITRFNAWTRTNAISIFLRIGVVQTVGIFDPRLGTGNGSMYGSAEDVEYIVRAVCHGFSIFYDPKLTIYHDNPTPVYDERSQKRARLYGGGLGGVLRAYRYPWWFVMKYWLRPIGGIMLSLLACRPDKCLYYWNMVQGRTTGWLHWRGDPIKPAAVNQVTQL